MKYIADIFQKLISIYILKKSLKQDNIYKLCLWMLEIKPILEKLNLDLHPTFSQNHLSITKKNFKNYKLCLCNTEEHSCLISTPPAGVKGEIYRPCTEICISPTLCKIP